MHFKELIEDVDIYHQTKGICQWIDRNKAKCQRYEDFGLIRIASSYSDQISSGDLEIYFLDMSKLICIYDTLDLYKLTEPCFVAGCVFIDGEDVRKHLVSLKRPGLNSIEQQLFYEEHPCLTYLALNGFLDFKEPMTFKRKGKDLSFTKLADEPSSVVCLSSCFEYVTALMQLRYI